LAASGVRNYDVVDAHLRRGGQPTAEGVATLAKVGVATIIDLRPRWEAPSPFDAERAAATHIARFESIPLSNWLAPREHDVERILGVIGEADAQPVFVHCHRGADRTGTIVAIYRIMNDCATVDDAIRDARAHGMAWWQVPMRRFIRRWDRTRRPERCR
jgi:protein tyrosine phosphatase (PTP) superfamily phosphohydrolase (DUF442 family)